MALQECKRKVGRVSIYTSIIHVLSLRYTAHASRHRKIKTAHFPLSEHWQPSQGDEIIHKEMEDKMPFGGVQQVWVTMFRKRKDSYMWWDHMKLWDLAS